jgi:Fe-S-cluster containining protein
MPVFCLSFHARYLCRHSGACCTSAWPIHVEDDRRAAWQGALDEGRLAFQPDCPDEADGGSPFLVPPDLPPEMSAVLRTRASGACVFYGREDGLCAVHRALGHDHLPAACQHFPRRCLIEPGRVSLSLSHYCPSVARLAFDAGVGSAIVPAPHALVGHVRLEGLDASDALPPLLRPGLLADRDTYHAWERLIVETLDLDVAPEEALDRISAVTERLREWSPGRGELRAALESARIVGGIDGRASASRDDQLGAGWWEEAYDVVRASVPAGITTLPAPTDVVPVDAALVQPAWRDCSRPVRRFLAAHAFGNWCAYHGMGLRTVVHSLEAALAVVRIEAVRLCAAANQSLDNDLLLEAFRAADLLLVHLSDPKVLATRLSAVEGRGRGVGAVFQVAGSWLSEL